MEEGELVGEGTEVKRRRLEGVVGRPGFTPFDYKGAKFTDYTMGESTSYTCSLIKSAG